MSPTDVPAPDGDPRATDLESPGPDLTEPDVASGRLGEAQQTDPELISRVRGGDVAAYGILFSRHVESATRLARQLVGHLDADDLVSEAFAKVLNVLLGGGGPDVAFRAYLLTSVRRLHIDKVRSNQRLTTTGDMTPFDPGVPFTDTAVAGFESGAAAKAFASLPERWQMVLWHLEVENQRPADIAPLLGMSANSVSALAYRAREGLRQAFLNMHGGDLVSEACQDTHDLMGGYVRGALSRRDSSRIEGHLERCRRCTAVYLELSEVNSSLAAVLGPALLGGAAAAYLGGTGVGAGWGAAVLALLGRGRDLAFGHAAAGAASATVVGVAGIATLVVVTHGPAEPATARPPGPITLARPDSAPAPGSTGPRSPGSGSSLTGSGATEVPSVTPRRGHSPRAAGRLPGSPRVPATRPASSPPAPGAAAPLPGGGKASKTRPNGDRPPRRTGSSPGTDTSGADPGRSPNRSPGRSPGHPPRTSPAPGQEVGPSPRSTIVDVGVQARLGSTVDHGTRAGLIAQVTGIPEGRRARLTVTSSTGDLHPHSSACQRSATGFTCVATHSHATFYFDVDTSSGPTVTFSVAAPQGCTDPAPANNSSSVKVPRHRDQAG